MAVPSGSAQRIDHLRPADRHDPTWQLWATRSATPGRTRRSRAIHPQRSRNRFPVPLTALAPLGSLAYTGSTTGAIATLGELDTYSLSVDGGQTISVVVTPGSPAGPSPLQPTIELRNPSGELVAVAVAPAAGQPAVIQVGPASTLGLYTITVGASVGADFYTIAVYLNAAIEAESAGGPSDNTRATAQNINGGFFGTVPGSQADRGVVRGTLTTATGEDFYALSLTAGQTMNLAQALTGFTSTTSFSPIRTSVPAAAGKYPIFVGYRDLNGDGKQDMVAVMNNTTNNTDASIGVRMGNGDATFGAFTLYPTGGVFARFLDFGDVNGDGMLDVVATNDGSPFVSLFLGNGNGTFQSAVNTPSLISGLGLTVRDINNDGRADAVVPHFSGFISVLIGQADGTLGTATTFSTGAGGPFGSAVGDLNGDGNLDVATANFSFGNMSVLLGNGLGGFGAPTVLPMAAGSWDVELVDLNGDGRLDAITGNQNANNITVRLGNGNGTFGNPAAFSTGGGGPRTVAVGDVNNDGKLDVVVPHISSGTIGVLVGNGNGTFAFPITFATGINPNQATIADLNGDGLLDLSSADAASGSISVRLNTTPIVRLELQDATGAVVASATRGATNFDQGLSFTPSASGVYFARVGTAPSVPYTLSPLRRGFDPSPRTRPPRQPVPGHRRASGRLQPRPTLSFRTPTRPSRGTSTTASLQYRAFGFRACLAQDLFPTHRGRPHRRAPLPAGFPVQRAHRHGRSQD